MGVPRTTSEPADKTAFMWGLFRYKLIRDCRMPELSQEPDLFNRMRWDGRSRIHVETWVLTLNQVSTGAAFHIRYGLLVPEKGRVSVQVSFTSCVPGRTGSDVAIAHNYPVDHLSWTDDPFWLEMGPCCIESGRVTGMLGAGGTAVTWDLLYQQVTDPLLNLPSRSRHDRAWGLVTPSPFTLFGGKIEIEDHQFMLNGDPGQLVHFWGSCYPSEWIWYHCSSFLGDGGEPLPVYVSGMTAQDPLLGAIMRRPKSFGHLVRGESHIKLDPVTSWRDRKAGHWQWKGLLGKEQATVEVTVPRRNLVLAEYDEPCGRRVYCHHSESADCRLQFQEAGRPPRLFRAEGMACVEIGANEADPAIARKLVF